MGSELRTALMGSPPHSLRLTGALEFRLTHWNSQRDTLLRVELEREWRGLPSFHQNPPRSCSGDLEAAEAGSQGPGRAGPTQALRGQLGSPPHIGAPRRFDCIFQIVGNLFFAENGEIIRKLNDT